MSLEEASKLIARVHPHAAGIARTLEKCAHDGGGAAYSRTLAFEIRAVQTIVEQCDEHVVERMMANSPGRIGQDNVGVFAEFGRCCRCR